MRYLRTANHDVPATRREHEKPSPYRSRRRCHRECGTAEVARRHGRSAAGRGARAAIIYHLKKTVSLDGRVRQQEPINRLAEVAVDLETLRDAQGRQYQIEPDASQEEDGGDVTYELRLLRTAARQQTDREIDLAWKDAHPGAPEQALEAFRSRRANQTRSAPRNRVTDDLVAWAGTASAVERRHVIVKLREHPSLSPFPKSIVRTSAVAEQLRARADAIEARKRQLAPLQAPVMETIRAGGGEIIRSYWLVNAFDAQITPELLDRLIRDERVERIETFAAGRPDALDDMRAAAQIVQLHDGDFTGERPSERNTTGDIYVGIIDTDIDMIHPAWTTPRPVSAGCARSGAGTAPRGIPLASPPWPRLHTAPKSRVSRSEISWTGRIRLSERRPIGVAAVSHPKRRSSSSKKAGPARWARSSKPWRFRST